MEIQEAKHRAKLCEWQQMVYECRNSGIPVTRWCKEHQLSVKTYYYRQRQVWKAATAKVNDMAEEFKQTPRFPAFAEVRLPQPQPIHRTSEPPAITVRRGKLVCEIHNGADPELLRQVLHLVDEHA